MADLPIVTTLTGVVNLVRALPHWSVAALSRPAPYVTGVPAVGVPIGWTSRRVPSSVPVPEATTLPAGSATS